MIVQGLIVAVVVVACTTYAAWTLMPAAARRGIAVALLKLPLHAVLTRRLGKHAVETSGCACDGCDRSTVAKKPPAAIQPLVFHRSVPRLPADD